MKIFFSYGHDENSVVVDLIKERLERKGYSVWIDKEEIHNGIDWRNSIREGIENSDDVVAFISKHSSRKGGVCGDELKIAVSVRGAIVKIALLEPMEQVNLSASLLTRQALDLTCWKKEKEKGEEAWNKWIDQISLEIMKIIESEENKLYHEEISYLKNVLNPYLGDSKETALLREKYINNKEVESKIYEWITKKTYRQVSYIASDPGTGKSMLAANLQHIYSNVICSIFCQHDKPEYYNVDTMIRTMAFKIAIKMVDYRKKLMDILKEEMNKKPNNKERLFTKLVGNTLFEKIILDPLNHLIDGGMEAQLIVIDGLDEADESRDEFAEIIINNSKYFPKWIKFLLTTRPEPKIMEKLGKCDKIPFDENDENIKQFVSEELNAFHLPKSKLDTILKKCDGNYLFAKIICEDIKLGNLSLDALEEVPEEISGYFREWFKKKFYPIQKYDLFKEIISLICGVASVSSKMMAECIGVDHNQVEAAINEGGYLINRQEESYTFFHKGVIDFLTDKKEAGIFYVNENRGNQILADYIHQHMEDVKKYYSYKTQLLLEYRNISSLDTNVDSVLKEKYKEKFLVYDNVGEILVGAYRWDDYIELLTHIFEKADIQIKHRIWDSYFANVGIEKYEIVKKMIKFVDYVPNYKYDISHFIERIKNYIPAYDICTYEAGYHDVLIPGVLDFRELDQFCVRTERVAILITESIDSLVDYAKSEWDSEVLKYFELVYYLDRCVQKCKEAGIPNLDQMITKYEKKRTGILTSIGKGSLNDNILGMLSQYLRATPEDTKAIMDNENSIFSRYELKRIFFDCFNHVCFIEFEDDGIREDYHTMCLAYQLLKDNGDERLINEFEILGAHIGTVKIVIEKILAFHPELKEDEAKYQRIEGFLEKYYKDEKLHFDSSIDLGHGYEISISYPYISDQILASNTKLGGLFSPDDKQFLILPICLRNTVSYVKANIDSFLKIDWLIGEEEIKDETTYVKENINHTFLYWNNSDVNLGENTFYNVYQLPQNMKQSQIKLKITLSCGFLETSIDNQDAIKKEIKEPNSDEIFKMAQEAFQNRYYGYSLRLLQKIKGYSKADEFRNTLINLLEPYNCNMDVNSCNRGLYDGHLVLHNGFGFHICDATRIKFVELFGYTDQDGLDYMAIGALEIMHSKIDISKEIKIDMEDNLYRQLEDIQNEYWIERQYGYRKLCWYTLIDKELCIQSTEYDDKASEEGTLDIELSKDKFNFNSNEKTT